jgi:hypothetical protein
MQYKILHNLSLDKFNKLDIKWYLNNKSNIDYNMFLFKGIIFVTIS